MEVVEGTSVGHTLNAGSSGASQNGAADAHKLVPVKKEDANGNGHAVVKDKKRRKKKKKAKIIKTKPEEKQAEEEKIEIEYVRQSEDELADPAFKEFADIFGKFSTPEELCAPKEEEEEYAEDYTEEQPDAVLPSDLEGGGAEVAAAALNSAKDKKGLSKKAAKRLKRLSIPILKQLVRRPDVVEVHDVNSSDPYFLVYLKAYRNTVAVPKHWAQKRKYLQNKRGIEKPAFQLPEFIAATGISRIRDAYAQKEEAKRLKQKQREKMQPKMGRVEIEYQILYDAFFKFQTKPKLSLQGDLYYECKEFEVQLKEKKPGQLSDDLKKALGMPENAPPPWLINMQRYGPPPSYPSLKVPGLNAPLPSGAAYGYHPGGWGKPPVDEVGRPLYGDVFGTAAPAPPPEVTAPVERARWGELEEEPEVESDEEEEQPQEGEEGEGQGEAMEEEAVLDGISSVPSGLETPDTIDLRKGGRREEETERDLYTVLEQQNAAVGGAFYGSSHKYVVPPTEKAEKPTRAGRGEKVDLMKSQKTEKVNITLNPTEVEEMEQLSEDLLKKKYEQYIHDKAEADKGEDVSDVIAENRKRKKVTEKKSSNKGGDKEEKSNKKYKDFKF